MFLRSKVKLIKTGGPSINPEDCYNINMKILFTDNVKWEYRFGKKQSQNQLPLPLGNSISDFGKLPPELKKK